MKGIIVKGIGGFYYVKPENESKTYECRARGIFRKDGESPRVGDLVTILALGEGEGVIESILPRKNLFVRPPVANVDCFVVVAAVARPAPNMAVIDKFAVTAEMNDAQVIICLNKIDLAAAEELSKVYEKAYPVLMTSAATGEGIEKLEEFLSGKKSALAGPSGVGKSTIINRLQHFEAAETGSVGVKSGRGKHTTRHVELFPLRNGGMVFDTPGFTSFDILEAEEEDLEFCYPEFAPYLGKCKFDNCKHIHEPECRVRQAAKEGEIHSLRYESYARQLTEIRERSKY